MISRTLTHDFPAETADSPGNEVIANSESCSILDRKLVRIELLLKPSIDWWELGIIYGQEAGRGEQPIEKRTSTWTSTTLFQASRDIFKSLRNTWP